MEAGRPDPRRDHTQDAVQEGTRQQGRQTGAAVRFTDLNLLPYRPGNNPVRLACPTRLGRRIGSSALQLQEIGQKSAAVVGKPGFGVELHAPDRVVAVPHRLDLPPVGRVGAPRDCYQRRR